MDLLPPACSYQKTNTTLHKVGDRVASTNAWVSHIYVRLACCRFHPLLAHCLCSTPLSSTANLWYLVVVPLKVPHKKYSQQSPITPAWGCHLCVQKENKFLSMMADVLKDVLCHNLSTHNNHNIPNKEGVYCEYKIWLKFYLMSIWWFSARLQ